MLGDEVTGQALILNLNLSVIISHSTNKVSWYPYLCCQYFISTENNFMSFYTYSHTKLNIIRVNM